MSKLSAELKYNILIEEYKRVGNEVAIYTKEMMKTFIYGSTLVGIYFGWGLHIDDNSSQLSQNIQSALPYAFFLLAMYFLSLSYIKISLMRFIADIENKINNVAYENLLTLESVYRQNVLSRGFVRFGKAQLACLPTPVVFFGILVAFALLTVFITDAIESHKAITLAMLFACGFGAIYVFFVYPRILDKAIKIQNNEKNNKYLRIDAE